MKCVRESIFDQCPTKISYLYPKERRNSELPYGSIDELRKHFELYIPDPLKSIERPSTNNQSGKSNQSDGSTTTKPKGSNSPGRKRKSKKSSSPPSSSAGKVMSVQADPFSQRFNH